MFIPQIDNIIDHLQSNPELIDLEIYNKLKAIYKEICCVKPKGDDDIRELWLDVSRGTIKEFGEAPYPDEKKWYQFTTSKYQEKLFFYFDSKLIFSINETEKPEKEKKYIDKDIYKFLTWLLYRVKKETERLKQNAESYNRYLEKNLSYHKRFGRIKRKDFWDNIGDNAIRLDEQLGAERIDKLRQFVDESKKHESSATIPQITADDYFKYCEICYNANDYFKESSKGLSPKEKYLQMADGRDAGLRSIESNSQEAFHNWYHGGERLGAHPWEICRGGNSTHISFFASFIENKWSIGLSGSSVARVVETVKMAVALYEKNIPFILSEAEAILRMVTGIDYIGIVPDYIFPRYCHGYFPKDDEIIDFMQLGFEENKTIIENTYWYPLEKIVINN